MNSCMGSNLSSTTDWLDDLGSRQDLAKVQGGAPASLTVRQPWNSIVLRRWDYYISFRVEEPSTLCKFTQLAREEVGLAPSLLHTKARILSPRRLKLWSSAPYLSVSISCLPKGLL